MIKHGRTGADCRPSNPYPPFPSEYVALRLTVPTQVGIGTHHPKILCGGSLCLVVAGCNSRDGKLPVQADDGVVSSDIAQGSRYYIQRHKQPVSVGVVFSTSTRVSSITTVFACLDLKIYILFINLYLFFAALIGLIRPPLS